MTYKCIHSFVTSELADEFHIPATFCLVKGPLYTIGQERALSRGLLETNLRTETGLEPWCSPQIFPVYITLATHPAHFFLLYLDRDFFTEINFYSNNAAFINKFTDRATWSADTAAGLLILLQYDILSTGCMGDWLCGLWETGFVGVWGTGFVGVWETGFVAGLRWKRGKIYSVGPFRRS